MQASPEHSVSIDLTVMRAIKFVLFVFLGSIAIGDELLAQGQFIKRGEDAWGISIGTSMSEFD